MEPIDYLVAMWRHKLLVLLLSVLGLAGGLLSVATSTPTYEAKSSVLLTPSPGVANHELGEVGNFMNYQIHSYAELVNSRVVLDPVLRDVRLPHGVDRLAQQVGAQVPVNTSIINITVTDTDPARAARLANAVAEHLETAVEAAAPEPSEDASTLELQTVATAATPGAPVAPRAVVHLTGGAGLGLLLGVLLALARHALDRSRQLPRHGPPGPEGAPVLFPRDRADASARREMEEVRP